MRFHGSISALEPDAIAHAGDRGEELIRLVGLANEIEGAARERSLDVFEGGLAGDHDHARVIARAVMRSITS